MLTLARTNNQALGNPVYGAVATSVGAWVGRCSQRPGDEDAFLCREFMKRLCNWVVGTCVEVEQGDVSDSVQREWLVDGTYEYGRCCFGIALGHITSVYGKAMTGGKALTFSCDGGTVVTLEAYQHNRNMWKAAIAGRTRSKGLDNYSDLYDHAMAQVAESCYRRLHSELEAMSAWRQGSRFHSAHYGVRYHSKSEPLWRADDHVKQCCCGRSDLISIA